MPHKTNYRYSDCPTSSSSSCSFSSSSWITSSSSSYSKCSSSKCSSSSSKSCSCKKSKKKCKYYLNPWNPAPCVNPCVNPCANPCVNPCNPCANPCVPCGPTPCNPCVPNPCSNPQTYNPFQFPNYTVVQVPSTTTSYPIPTAACSSSFIYSFNPPSSQPVNVYIPQITTFDCSYKRNFVFTNKGSSTVYLISTGSDTFNGASYPSGYPVGPGQSVQIYSDTVNNWIVIGGTIIF